MFRRATLAALLVFVASRAVAQESFSFSIEEVAKKPFEWGGYAELRSDWTRWRTESPFRRLARPGGQPATSLRLQPGLTLNGTLRHGPFRLVASGNATYLADSTDVGRGDALLYEAYGLAEWTPGNAVAFGKRVLRWSKSYAFQPVGFVERARDPTDPDAAREGYWMGSLELTRSLADAGPLRTFGATAALLPVIPALNREFATDRGLNAALRLTALSPPPISTSTPSPAVRGPTASASERGGTCCPNSWSTESWPGPRRNRARRSIPPRAGSGGSPPVASPALLGCAGRAPPTPR